MLEMILLLSSLRQITAINYQNLKLFQKRMEAYRLLQIISSEGTVMMMVLNMGLVE